MSRQTRFAILFAGLGVVTLIFLLAVARFVLFLIPVGEEQTTIQAQPIVHVYVTQVVTEIVEVVVTPTPVAEQLAVSHQPSAISRQPSATPIPDPRSPIPDPQSPIPDPQSPIPDPQSPAPNPQSPTAVPQPPQLIIPALDIHKTILHIPVENGHWNITALASGIGHLETTGTYPGDDMGMTFIAHVTRPWPEIAGPFADLIFMQPGDEIIYRSQGIDYVYELESFARVNPELVESLYVADGDVITLATCDTWDFVNFGYANRLLARARLVRQEPANGHPVPQQDDTGVSIFSQ